MSDPRFARLKTDPRFRRTKKEKQKVVVDDRFRGLLDGDKKRKARKGRVDKYGRPLADTHEQDNLRRFYRLHGEDEPAPKAGPDYARGEALLESSDEEEGNEKPASDDESDEEGVLVLGRDVSKPIPVPRGDEDAEIDLDEDTYAELDAQAAAYAKENPETDNTVPDTDRTRRIAVVNLDWDHVRAIHLYKIFSSLVSPTAPAAASTSTSRGARVKGSGIVVRGKVISVRVYPSEFGKERMAREETEGPPLELFKKKEDEDKDEINEKTIFEVGGGEDYDEDALRKYQIERLRYYYAIVECDSVDAASHIYDELEGTELERSANVFDLSFVPDGMTFDDEPRDEATDDPSVPYKGLEFVTDALRHSKVKLTWDEDDPERVQLTRRVLSRKEIEENDFRAYIASSTSGSESEAEPAPKSKGKGKSKNAEREKLRTLLLGGDDDALPEGWGGVRNLPATHTDGQDVDMEITFTPGLSERKDEEDETTLEKYKRKIKEKKKKRKEEVLEKRKVKGEDNEEERKEGKGGHDDFFAGESDEEDGEGGEGGEGAEVESVHMEKGKQDKGQGRRKKGRRQSASPPPVRHVSTAEELALVAGPSSDGADEPRHFNMKAVIKAEKGARLKHKKRKGKNSVEEENELQENFRIDVNDDRFKAVLEDHAFAIDPSNPRFKGTKSMKAILDERSRRQRNEPRDDSRGVTDKGTADLKSLVERVKRKSAAVDESGSGKRRKVI